MTKPGKMIRFGKKRLGTKRGRREWRPDTILRPASTKSAIALPPGTYFADGECVISCPGCGMIALLQHSIDDDGRVDPAVGCCGCGAEMTVLLDHYGA